MKKELKFDTYSMEALKIMEQTNKNLFFTGKAGAGKSTIINYFISKTKKKFALLGTTGISAENIGGETIHRFFGISVNCKLKTLSMDKIQQIRDTDIFIIDEVSMLRSDLFDAMNVRMKKVMQSDEIFGGKQFIFVGDLYQLPPVVTDYDTYLKENYESPFFFYAKSFVIDKFTVIELQKVHRQNDESFIKNLNWIREGVKAQQILDYFNARVVSPSEVNPKAILIATTNKIVEEVNKRKLAELETQEYTFKSFYGGEFERDEFPTDETLKLKIGARIMFVVNDRNGRYQNGTLGTITYINPETDMLRVDIDNRGEIEVEKFKWNKTNGRKDSHPIDGDSEEDEEEVIGRFKNFPIKLAFAITIHKVQGKTFDHVIIDMGRGAFAEGQLYVALSRCTSYEGLQLLKPIKLSDVISNYRVRNFISNNKI